MRQVTNLMAHSAYAALVALKGARFQMFGGRGLHEWLSGAEVNLVTDKTALLIWADIDELGQWEGIDGGEPDYSTLNVSKSDLGLAERTLEDSCSSSTGEKR